MTNKRPFSPAALARDFQKQREKETNSVNVWLTTQLIKAIKLPKPERDRLYEYVAAEGKRGITITDFRAAFPRFPVYVTVREKIPLRDSASLQMIFPVERILKHSMIVDFAEMLKQEKHEIGPRASVVLIMWPGRMPVALHNMPTPTNTSRVGITIDDGKKLKLTLEPLEQIATSLGWDEE